MSVGLLILWPHLMKREVNPGSVSKKQEYKLKWPFIVVYYILRRINITRFWIGRSRGRAITRSSELDDTVCWWGIRCVGPVCELGVRISGFRLWWLILCQHNWAKGVPRHLTKHYSGCVCDGFSEWASHLNHWGKKIALLKCVWASSDQLKTWTE